MQNLNVIYLPTGQLSPYPRNARMHTPKQIQQIAASIERFGFNNPILVDSGNQILAGHGRWRAAQKLGLVEVPVVRLDHMSDAEKRAYIIADNRLAELADWDEEILRIEFQHLESIEVDFPLEITGFETVLLDRLLGDDAEQKLDEADAIPALGEGPTITRKGDLWLLGNHRLVCGDARKSESYDLLMGQERADMSFCDPPYNVEIEGNVSGLGKVRHKEFIMASGEMSTSEFTEFLRSSLEQTAAYSRDGSIHFMCMDWRHIGEMLTAGTATFAELKNLIVWTKTNAGMGTFYRSQHELIFAFKKGSAAHTNTFGLGAGGRYRTNVWNYPGANAFTRTRDAELEMHPSVKPAALVADAIKDVTKRKEIVLDSFAGSGTTAIAAEKTSRFARLLEFDERFCDVICRRFQSYTNRPAILASTGVKFDDISAEQLRSPGAQEQSDG